MKLKVRLDKHIQVLEIINEKKQKKHVPLVMRLLRELTEVNLPNPKAPN